MILVVIDTSSPSLPNKRGEGAFYQMLKNSEIVEKGNLNYFELDDYVPPLICVKCCNIWYFLLTFSFFTQPLFAKDFLISGN